MGQYDPTTPNKVNVFSVSLFFALCGLAYAGVFYLPHFYPVYRLSGQMKEICYEAYRVVDDRKIMLRLLEEAKGVGLEGIHEEHFEIERIPFEPEELFDIADEKTKQRGKEMYITFNYEVDAKWPFLEKYTRLTFRKVRHSDLKRVEW